MSKQAKPPPPGDKPTGSAPPPPPTWRNWIWPIAIFAILFLSSVYYRSSGAAQLASIGLLSFAAITQLAPAFFGGLIWRRGTAAGAIGVWADLEDLVVPMMLAWPGKQGTW